MKAMILAAGFGTRLKPLSDMTPKPLLPFLNKPILEHCISFLRKQGIVDIIINVHHLGDKIVDSLGNGEKYDVRLSYSREDTILGTGGGIKKAKEFLCDSESFIVMNSDFIVDFDLTATIDFHRQSKAIATMILREDEHMEQYGTIGINEKGEIKKFTSLFGQDDPSLQKGHFTGIHVFSNRIFDYLDKEDCDFFCINKDIYSKLFEHKEIVCGALMQGKWFDLGTLEDYFRIQMECLGDQKSVGIRCSMASEVTLNNPVLIGENSIVEKGSVIGPYAIIGNNCHIQENVCLHDCIVFDGLTIPIDSTICDQVVYKQ